MLDQINEVRAQRLAVQSERASLQVIAANRSEARGLITSWCGNVAADGTAALRSIIEAVHTSGHVNARPMQILPGGYGTDLAPLLAALIGPKKLADLLCAQLDVIPDVPGADERQAHIAELDAEIHRLEVEEERLIRAAEAEGQSVARRPDATLSIVLALQLDAATA